MRRIYPSLWLVLLCFCTHTGFSQPDLILNQITSVASPLDITGAGDGSGRLFIASRAGTIRIFDLNTNTLLGGNFLNISTQVTTTGEKGLLGLAFHPNYENNGYFYVCYSPSAVNTTRVSRFTASPPSSNSVSTATELVIINITQPATTNHKGGKIAFGPDGYLYIASGDGGGGGDPNNYAQNGQELLGKMLRIDVNSTNGSVNYVIPTSNPFYGTQSPEVKDEIWALGLRNPWRFSFDRSTGDMWIADVGQDFWEEVNFQGAGSPGGENYGWRCYEGNHNFNTAGCGSPGAYDSPVFEYFDNPAGGRSITGGYVYRGTDVPSLTGWYIVTDYITDHFWLIQPNGSGWTVDYQPDVLPVSTDIVTFGEDDDGELYAGKLGGAIYKISATPLPVELLNFSGDFKEGRVQLIWNTATEKNTAFFQVERKSENWEYEPIGTVAAAGESFFHKGYTFNDPNPRPGSNLYRLKMVDLDQTFEYSPAIAVEVKQTAQWQFFPNPSTGKVSLLMNTDIGASALKFEVLNVQGERVFLHEASAPDPSYSQEFNLEFLPSGIYFCRLDVDGKVEFGRLVIK